MMGEEIKQAIQNELKKKHKAIRNQNAIDKFLECFLPPVAVLKDIITGSKRAIEYEKQIITIDKVLDLVIAFDEKLSKSSHSRGTVGILSKGKNLSVQSCDFYTDIGIQDEGEGTIIGSCRFIK